MWLPRRRRHPASAQQQRIPGHQSTRISTRVASARTYLPLPPNRISRPRPIMPRRASRAISFQRSAFMPERPSAVRWSGFDGQADDQPVGVEARRGFRPPSDPSCLSRGDERRAHETSSRPQIWHSPPVMSRTCLPSSSPARRCWRSQPASAPSCCFVVPRQARPITWKRASATCASSIRRATPVFPAGGPAAVRLSCNWPRPFPTSGRPATLTALDASQADRANRQPCCSCPSAARGAKVDPADLTSLLYARFLEPEWPETDEGC